jgi:hypothetical protein
MEGPVIIDAHAHPGVDLVFEEVRGEEEIMAMIDANSVNATILQGIYGHTYLDEIEDNHNRTRRSGASGNWGLSA